MTTDKNNAAPGPHPAELANASVVEQIAQQWDGFQYDAPGEMVDIGAAIRRAGKRLSAELAEQQGVSLPPFPRTYYDAFGDSSEPLYTGKQMQDYARAALAATGKQQVGVFPWENLPAYLIDKCEGDTISEEGIQRAVADMARDARYCQQQVGEVQGDAFALARELRAAMYEADGRLGMADLVRKGHVKDVECGINVLAATLAARQPGAQEPEVEFQCRLMDVKTDLPTENWHHSPTYEENPGRGTHYWVQFRKRYIYYTPPAQGIDLGQLERIRNELHSMSGQLPDEWIDPIVELQQDVQKLIDSQRDTSPGVGNG